MLKINRKFEIPESELSWTFTRASGPGGQNVNKVSSKALLRWKLHENTSLPADAKERLRAQQKRRLTNEDELIVTSQRFRDQEKNRHDCLEKLRAMILAALHKPKVRKKTKPTKAAREKRLRSKRHRSQVKQMRQEPRGE